MLIVTSGGLGRIQALKRLVFAGDKRQAITSQGSKRPLRNQVRLDPLRPTAPLAAGPDPRIRQGRVTSDEGLPEPPPWLAEPEPEKRHWIA